MSQGAGVQANPGALLADSTRGLVPLRGACAPAGALRDVMRP